MLYNLAPGFDELELQMDEIYCNQGYGGSMPDAETTANIQKILSIARDICKPRAVFRIYSARLDGNHLLIDNVEMKTGKIISNYLSLTSRIAVFAVTAGIEYDNYLQHLKQQGDIYMEFLADAVGSEIAEATVRLVSRRVEEVAARELMYVTLSYSPGYCGWHVREQQKLFSLLPEKPCGISLNESCLMHPVKSVSGIIGLSSFAGIQVPYSCDICGLETCFKRKSIQ